MLSKTNQSGREGWKYLLALPLLAGMLLLSGWSASAQDQAKKSKEEIAKMAVEKELLKAGYSKADIDEIKMRIDGTVEKVVMGQPTKAPKPEKLVMKDGTEGEKKVFLIVEDMPKFQNGDIKDFRNWIQKNVKYPKVAIDNKISGTVYVSFVVNTEGDITDIKIARGIDPSLDAAALEAIKSSPKWEPGKQRGEAVNVSFNIPVKFSLD